MQTIVIDKDTLTIGEVVAVARQGVRVEASRQGEGAGGKSPGTHR